MMRAMRQIRLGLVMVWLVGCGSSNTTTVDAPSPDSPASTGADARVIDARPADARVADAPAGGGSADAPSGGGSADAPSGGGSADAPTGGGADAPVETPDAPVETPDAPVETPDAPVETPDAMTNLCGNGVVDPGETCDTAINAGEGACPTTCTDGDVDLCTAAVLSGGGTCQAACSSQPVAATNGDGLCCPPATSDNDSDCGNVGFRITSLVLEDPHVWTTLLNNAGDTTCRDQTATINGAIDDDLNAGNSGHLALSPVVLFQPLNDKAGGTTIADLVFASCTAPAASSSCSATGATTRFEGTADVMNSAADATDPCLDVLDNTHNDTYGDITTPAPACFGVPFGTVTLNVPITTPFGPGELILVLTDVVAAATYHPGTGANDQLVDGELRGFLTTTSAGGESHIHVDIGIDLAVGTFLAGGNNNCAATLDMPIDDRDKHDPGDADVNGWYFYLKFTGVKVPYSETP